MLKLRMAGMLFGVIRSRRLIRVKTSVSLHKHGSSVFRPATDVGPGRIGLPVRDGPAHIQ